MITNDTNIPLSLAVWLLHDSYDHSDDPNTISVTSLLKPLRSILLTRNVSLTKDFDLSEMIPSKMGTALHEAVEVAWKKVTKGTLHKLGLSEKAIDRVVINPDKINPGDIPIYMERRSNKSMGKFTITGKFDFVIEGTLEDFKSTSTWAWIYQSNIDSYQKQGSIYRWLNQDIITSDHINISYIFTDWSATKAKQDKGYPQSRIQVQKIPLMSIAATEQFIKKILQNIERLEALGNSALPDCTKEELWQSDSVWKYYKNPNSTTRSTKNFDNPTDANLRLVQDGTVGKIVEVPGEVKRCKYCNASPICTQREHLELTGALKP